MAQIRGTAGYHLGNQQFGGPGSADVRCSLLLFSTLWIAPTDVLTAVIGIGLFANIEEQTSDPSPLDAIREQTNKIEDWLDTMSEPLKP
jgi:hypothetical protein